MITMHRKTPALRRALLGLLLTAGLAACQTAEAPGPSAAAASPASAAATSDRGTFLSFAAAARDACGARMPDSRATRSALADAGIAPYGTRGPFWVHSPRIGEMVVATSASGRTPFCFIGIRGMTAEEARTLIAPWVAQASGRPAPQLSDEYRDGWIGRIGGRPVAIVVVDDFRIPRLISGRAIGMRFE